MQQPTQLTTQDRELTVKQRKFLEKYIELGNATEAAMQAYDCSDRVTAASIGHENLKKLQIEELLEDFGLTDHKLLTKLDEGLDATKQLAVRVVKAKGRQMVDKAAMGELAGANEDTDDFIEVPDYYARHAYLETALKLKKRLGSKNDAPPITNNILVMPAEMIEKYGVAQRGAEGSSER